MNFGPLSSLNEGLRVIEGEVIETAAHSGGVLGIARGTVNGSTVYGAAWQGDWNCAYMILPAAAATLDDAAFYLADFAFADDAAGLVATSHRWTLSRLHCRKLIPGAGMLTVVFGETERRKLPRWAGISTPVGEMWRIEAENGTECLLLASDLAMGYLSPFAVSDDSADGEVRWPYVADGRAGSLRFAENITKFSWK
jgi:hypothetical protein